MKSINLMAFFIFLILTSSDIFAHCDTVDGPVIKDAKQALEKKEVSTVLKWIKPEFETQIKEAFNDTLKVSAKGPDVKKLAENYFFETLVRIHREGEGAPYTGLKQSGKPEPIIVMADKSLETGKIEELIKDLTTETERAIHKKFTQALEKKKNVNKSVEEGREFVEAYVIYVHFVEALQGLLKEKNKPAEEHSSEHHH